MKLKRLYAEDLSGGLETIDEGLKSTLSSLLGLFKGNPTKLAQQVVQSVKKNPQIAKKGQQVASRLMRVDASGLQEKFGDHPAFHEYLSFVQRTIDNIAKLVGIKEDTEYSGIMAMFLGFIGIGPVAAISFIAGAPVTAVTAAIAGVIVGLYGFVSASLAATKPY